MGILLYIKRDHDHSHIRANLTLVKILPRHIPKYLAGAWQPAYQLISCRIQILGQYLHGNLSNSVILHWYIIEIKHKRVNLAQ